MKSAGDSMFPEPRSIDGNGSTAVSQVPRTLLNVIDDSDRVAVAQNHLGERQQNFEHVARVSDSEQLHRTI